MKIASMLQFCEEVKLPRKGGKDFLRYIQNMFNDYQILLTKLSGDDSVTIQVVEQQVLVKQVCGLIEQSVEKYFSGFPAGAYELLSGAVRLLDDYLKHMMTAPYRMDLKHLYRARKGTLDEFTKAQMFHVGFDERTKISTMRYSIQGHPCLYLGGSVYICWEELGRPQFDVLHVSRFRQKGGSDLRVLDFGLRPEMLGALLMAEPNTPSKSDAWDYVVAYVLCWPLLASCCIQVNDPEKTFKPEYVVPQLLLQNVRERNLADGIRYFSTRVNSYNTNLSIPSNYVFPAQINASAGYCSVLRDRFEMTEPIAWTILKSTRSTMGSVPNMTSNIELVKNQPIVYGHTEFCEIEQRLEQMKCEAMMP